MQYMNVKLIPMNSRRANELLVSLCRPDYLKGTADGINLAWRCRLIDALERVKELETENESLRSDLICFQMEEDAREE